MELFGKRIEFSRGLGRSVPLALGTLGVFGTILSGCGRPSQTTIAPVEPARTTIAAAPSVDYSVPFGNLSAGRVSTDNFGNILRERGSLVSTKLRQPGLEAGARSGYLYDLVNMGLLDSAERALDNGWYLSAYNAMGQIINTPVTNGIRLTELGVQRRDPWFKPRIYKTYAEAMLQISSGYSDYEGRIGLSRRDLISGARTWIGYAENSVFAFTNHGPINVLDLNNEQRLSRIASLTLQINGDPSLEGKNLPMLMLFLEADRLNADNQAIMMDLGPEPRTADYKEAETELRGLLARKLDGRPIVYVGSDRSSGSAWLPVLVFNNLSTVRVGLAGKTGDLQHLRDAEYCSNQAMLYLMRYYAGAYGIEVDPASAGSLDKSYVFGIYDKTMRAILSEKPYNISMARDFYLLTWYTLNGLSEINAHYVYLYHKNGLGTIPERENAGREIDSYLRWEGDTPSPMSNVIINSLGEIQRYETLWRPRD